MKIGIAQINTVAGDYPGNARRILQAYRECLDLGAEYVVIPEGAHHGWGGPLVSDEAQALQALDYLASEIREVPLIAATGDSGGRVTVMVSGRNAANLEGQGVQVFSWAGKKIAIAIPGFSGPLGAPPGVPVVVPQNSPFGTPPRFEPAGSPWLHCNAVGGCGGQVYPGGSIAYAADGGVITRLARFAEECCVVDLDGRRGGEPASDAIEELKAALSLGLRDYVRKSGFLGVCVGLDGSVEAALLAMMAVELFDHEQVFGVIRPGGVKCSQIVNNLGISCQEVDSGPVLEAAGQAVGGGLSLEDRTTVEGLLFAAFAERHGLLPLLPYRRIHRLTGEFPLIEGLAPFGELWTEELQQLAARYWPEVREIELPPLETVAREVDRGSDREDLLRKGLPEGEVLTFLRRQDRARPRLRQAPLSLQVGLPAKSFCFSRRGFS